MAVSEVSRSGKAMIEKEMGALSLNSSCIHFSEDEIAKGWEILDPYCVLDQRSFLKEDPYKKENKEPLFERQLKQLTNFGNIGGNPETRVTTDDDSFVEANWITPNLIATGYPTKGKPRENYWKMVETLQKTHNLFIVNFMSGNDVDRYGGWFIEPDKENHQKYSVFDYPCQSGSITYYHYPYWVDFGEGDQEDIGEIIRKIYEGSIHLKKFLILVNCRAGVGRTGTFANLFHFYQKIKEGKELRKGDFSIDAIVENVIAFRRERGDQQFVQSKEQFRMLSKMVEQFFNEELDNRAGKG